MPLRPSAPCFPEASLSSGLSHPAQAPLTQAPSPAPAVDGERRRLLRFGGALSGGLLLAACATPMPAPPPVAGAPASPAGSGPALPPAGGASAAVAPAPAVGAPEAPAPVAPPPSAPPRPPRIGLALGGGAARGFAHIGVIQVLEENGIRPDLVVGTSAGSLVAALYAAGHDGRKLGQMADGMDESTITDWSFPLRGVIRGEALARYVREQTGRRTIEAMKLPLGIVATDLANGEPILFQRGDTGLAVRASSSVPGVFQPVTINGKEYVDGGLVAPVPVRYARQMGADLVIAVDISSPPEGNTTSDAMKVLLQTFAIMGRSINNFELREADVVMRPKLNGISSADFAARKRSIQAGRDIAQSLLPQLRRAIQAKTR